MKRLTVDEVNHERRKILPKVVWIGRLRWRHRMRNLIFLLKMGLKGYEPTVQWGKDTP